MSDVIAYLRIEASKRWDHMPEGEQAVELSTAETEAEGKGYVLRPSGHPVASVKQLRPGLYWLFWGVVEADA